MRIINLPKTSDTLRGEKRQYFSCVLECNCPKCNISITHDFSSKPINYPIWGERSKVWLWCQDCEYEWPVKIRPEISITLL
jgi:hypothetical protein